MTSNFDPGVPPNNQLGTPPRGRRASGSSGCLWFIIVIIIILAIWWAGWGWGTHGGYWSRRGTVVAPMTSPMVHQNMMPATAPATTRP